MTCNPNWPEITDDLLADDAPAEQGRVHHQSPSDCPDLIACVFKMKRQALLRKCRDGYFGEVIASVFSNEFQKRGNPHMHLLLMLADEWKFRIPIDVDSVVSAQLPDPETQPELSYSDNSHDPWTMWSRASQ